MRSKRISSAILTVLLVFSFLTAGSVLPSSALSYTKRRIVDTTFEGCEVTESFANTLQNSGINYINGSSHIKIVTGAEGLTGKTLLSENTDLIWWALYNYDQKMHFGATFEFCEPGTVNLVLGIGTQSKKNNDQITSGALFKIKDNKGVPVLTDRKGREVATLTYNEKYSIAAEATRGSSTYTLKVNGEVVADDCEHIAEIYVVTGMRLRHEKGLVKIDDIFFDTEGREYPQKYSMQAAYAELPEIIDFKKDDYKVTQVFLNNIKEPVATGKGGKKIKLDLADLINKAKIDSSSYDSSAKINKKVSLSYIEDFLKAKIWFDEATNTVLITTGKYKEDGILRAFRGKMYMNGQPFYDIGFNKFDLLWQFYASTTGTYESDFPDDEWGVGRATEALDQLQEMGVRSIRVFCNQGGSDTVFDEEKKEGYYRSLEAMFDACTAHGIKVVVCLNLINSKFLASDLVDGQYVPKGETYLDIVADPASESRKIMKEWLKETITRFKDNEAVLMWEVNNEGNLGCDVGAQTHSLCYSALQLAEFYADVADVMREADPEHLITTGDSTLRGAQWNLLKGVLEWSTYPNWTTDTPQERLMMLHMLNEKYDVIGAHTYDSGLNGEKGMTDDGETVSMPMKMYVEDAARLGKPFYSGETNVSTGVGDRLADMSTADVISDFLDQYIDAGVQITHWWAFHTDRKSQYDSDLTIGVRKGNEVHEKVMEVFIQKNRELNERYVVNGYKYNSLEGYKGEGPNIKQFLVIGGTVITALAVCAVVIILVIKKKSKAK